MKIPHLVLIAGITSGLTFTAVAQDASPTSAGTAANQSDAASTMEHHKGGDVQKRSRSRHRKEVKDNGTVVKEREQQRERTNGNTVQEQRREQRTNGTETQSRKQGRSKKVDDASPAPSPR